MNLKMWDFKLFTKLLLCCFVGEKDPVLVEFWGVEGKGSETLKE